MQHLLSRARVDERQMLDAAAALSSPTPAATGRTVTPGHCGDAATSMAPSKPTSDGMPTPTRHHGNDLQLP
jgi:hypothetical protein